MALLVLFLVLVAVAVAGLLWGVDSRESHNNWNRF
jgi:nitrogen fixation-related uncharacterized protein